jgi:hypothetical protein
MATANPLIAPSPLKDIINPQFYQNNFPAEIFIKSELGIKLDKGKFYMLAIDSDAQVSSLEQMTKSVAYP